MFTDFGYTKMDMLSFPGKKLTAYWYAPPKDQEHLPRVFISELRVRLCMPNVLKGVMWRNYCPGTKSSRTSKFQFQFATPHYAAHILYYGVCTTYLMYVVPKLQCFTVKSRCGLELTTPRRALNHILFTDGTGLCQYSTCTDLSCAPVNSCCFAV